jgi:hypothetical protein
MYARQLLNRRKHRDDFRRAQHVSVFAAADFISRACSKPLDAARDAVGGTAICRRRGARRDAGRLY